VFGFGFGNIDITDPGPHFGDVLRPHGIDANDTDHHALDVERPNLAPLRTVKFVRVGAPPPQRVTLLDCFVSVRDMCTN